MVKAFLFDYGGVMTVGGKGEELTDRLGAVLGVTSRQAYNVLRPVWEAYMRGAIAEPELWAHVERESGQRILPAQRGIWNTWANMAVLPEMQALIRRLKASGYGVGLLSNTVPNTGREIRRGGGYNAFDFTVLSCEVGLAKPDPAIYQLALSKLGGMIPQEVVFIDDQERCLAPAQALGMGTIHARQPQQVVADVERIAQLGAA